MIEVDRNSFAIGIFVGMILGAVEIIFIVEFARWLYRRTQRNK